MRKKVQKKKSGHPSGDYSKLGIAEKKSYHKVVDHRNPGLLSKTISPVKNDDQATTSSVGKPTLHDKSMSCPMK